MLGLCLMLFLLGGISLDLWRAFSERRSLAATAGAAVAGASALDEAAYRAPAQSASCRRMRSGRASLADQLDRGLRDARRGDRGHGDGHRRRLRRLSLLQIVARRRVRHHGARHRPPAGFAVIAGHHMDTIRSVTRIRLRSVDAPLDRPAAAWEAVRFLSTAEVLGLLPASPESIETLDVRIVARC
jgi:hypothetical protein